MTTTACPQCAATNPEGSKFCESCGAALTAVPSTPAPPIPAPPVPPPGTTNAKPRSRALVIGLVAAGAVILLSVGGVGVGLALSGLALPAAPNVPKPVVVGADRDREPTRTPSPEATEEPDVVPDAQPIIVRQFKSPSGNIRCSIAELEGQTSVTCYQPNVNYPVPSQACTTGPSGVVVAVDEMGTYWPCLSGSIEPSEVLPLDTPVIYNGMWCSINYDTGVTCINANDRGFTMEYDRGVQVF